MLPETESLNIGLGQLIVQMMEFKKTECGRNDGLMTRHVDNVMF